MIKIFYAQNKDIPYLKDLWRECFDDTEEFIEFYYQFIFNKDETLLIWDGNVPVAALQMIPYQIKEGQNTYKAAYISGAMTMPSYQGKGLMRSLLTEAFEEMRKDNCRYSFLIPQGASLIDFYSKFGYKSAFPLRQEIVSVSDFNSPTCNLPKIYKTLSELDISYLYTHYLHLLGKKDDFVIKSILHFEWMLRDLFRDGGCVFHVDGPSQALAFALLWDEQIFVKELLCENASMETELISAIKETLCPLARDGNINILRAGQAPCAKYYGMIKDLANDSNMPLNSYMSMMLN